MIYFLLAVLLTYIIAILALPFPHWPSYWHVVRQSVFSPYPNFKQRASMAWYLARDILLLPVFAAFWLADEILFRRYREVQIKEPVFIISQPRSGTTFLLRTLSRDKDTFLSVKHLEWRYPYISFWKLMDLLMLRDWLENRSYWPNTPLGRTCQKIHYHVLGVFEEFGIFLEERFYHHYFVFRRFPFPSVLDFVTDYKCLSRKKQNALVETFVRVVKKVYFYRGSNEIFLTKENEAVDFYDLLLNAFPDARLLFIVREPSKVLKSYKIMSLTCTEVKHGLDPEQVPGWHDANMRFRREECRKFIDFYRMMRTERRNVLITFNQFTMEIYKTALLVYRELGLHLSPQYRQVLETLQAEQDKRVPGYQNMECDVRGFEFFADFVDAAEGVATASTSLGGTS